MLNVYGIVYLVINKIDGKIYVGQTVDPLIKRWRRHLSTARNGRGYHLHSSIRKYGEDAFDCVVLHQAFSKEELNKMEEAAIISFDACNQTVGYNLTFGGEGGRPSEETRKKLIANNPLTGVGHTEATKLKMRLAPRPSVSAATRAAQSVRRRGEGNPRFGKPMSAETKAKIAAGNKGKIRTPEHLRNLSEAQHRRQFRKLQELEMKGNLLNEKGT